MHLVKNILKAYANARSINDVSKYGTATFSESEIKKMVGKAKRDYGTTNNTLRRLCDHGVLRRDIGLCKSSRRPSWLYSIAMNSNEIDAYIVRKEQAAEQYKNRGKVFEFGEQHSLTTKTKSSPLMIGYGLAPDHLQFKCLVVSDEYEMVTEKIGYSGRNTIIYFKKR